MTAPRIASLCTGYSGLDMAVQAVFGGEVAWVSDIDPGACKVIAHRHPGITNIGDLTAADWHQILDTFGRPDIVTGGYPCQPFSVAGLQKGTADERHIWPYIANALRVLRPRLAVFENVAGHLRLGFDTVLADLARIGFDAEWCVASASEVGAPHQRRRLIFLAWPAGAAGTGWAGAGVRGRASERGSAAADAADLGHEWGWGARRGGMDLRTTVSLLPTPRASDGEKGGPNQRGSKGDLALPSAVVQLLPTPTVADSRGTQNATSGRTNPDSNHHAGTTLGDLVFGGELLPTPTAADGDRTGATYSRGNPTLLGAVSSPPSVAGSTSSDDTHLQQLTIAID